MTPTKADLPATIIKSDRTGRLRYTQQYKDEVLAAYQASGMSGPAFAEHCGLKYPTFASWAAKRKKKNGSGSQAQAAGAQQFVLAEFATAPGSGGLLVELPGGARAQLAEAGQADLLAALIRSLAR